MKTILEEQKKRVAETAGKYRDPQLFLDFNDDEQRQLESNKRHWDKRLRAIDQELASEPERIQAHLRGQGPAHRAGRAGLSLARYGVTSWPEIRN